MLRTIVVFAVVLLVPLVLASGSNTWTGFGNDLENTRYQPYSNQNLNFNNPKNFLINWFYPASVGVSSTPTVTSNRIYYGDLGGYLYALRLDGTLVWKVYLQDILPGNYQWLTRSSPVIKGNLLICGAAFNPGNGYPTVGPSVFALNKNTGALVYNTTIEDHFAASITTSPTLVNNLAIFGVSSQEEYAAISPLYPCCSFRGSVVAVNVLTGAIVWKVYLQDILPGNYQWLTRSSPVIKGNLLICGAAFNPGNGYPTVGPSVFALNKNTGALVYNTTIEDHFAATITTSPTLVNNLAIFGVFS
jgi:polyvinyl alcohol dehydrogenase (cytochrome)